MERIEQLEDVAMTILNESGHNDYVEWMRKKDLKEIKFDFTHWLMTQIARNLYENLSHAHGLWSNIKEPIPEKLQKICDEVYNYSRKLRQYIPHSDQFDDNAPLLSGEEVAKRGMLPGSLDLDYDSGTMPEQASVDYQPKDQDAYYAYLYFVVKSTLKQFDNLLERVSEQQAEIFPENAGKKPILFDAVWKIHNDMDSYKKELLNYFHGDENAIYKIQDRVLNSIRN